MVLLVVALLMPIGLALNPYLYSRVDRRVFFPTRLSLSSTCTCTPLRAALSRKSSTRLHSVRVMILKDDEDTDDDDNDKEEEEEEEEEEKEDPYTQKATSEFQDVDVKDSSALASSLGGSAVDWGGALGKLRQRMQDVESGKSRDPSTALFRYMSAKTPNELIGTFVQTANPKVVQACSDAVNSLLGGLSSPLMGIETIVRTNGDKIASLCFQLQMTGYLFRNVEYVLAPQGNDGRHHLARLPTSL
jgi:Protein of unknown function (DUF760)